MNGLLFLVTNSDSTLNAILVYFESRLIRVEFTIFAAIIYALTEVRRVGLLIDKYPDTNFYEYSSTYVEGV